MTTKSRCRQSESNGPHSCELQPVFDALRAILQKHAGGFSVTRDTASTYGFDAPIGPATLQAWRGKMKTPAIPVAWVQCARNYVSYHLMGVYGCPKLLEHCSPQLRARMQGKSCFNFKTVDEPLFAELDRLTAASLAAFRNSGFIAAGNV